MLSINHANLTHPTHYRNMMVKIDAKLHESLSIRELQVLSLWILGYTMVQIGQCLYISHRTVETHLTHVKDKFQLRDREEIINYLIQLDLFDELVYLSKQFHCA